MPHRPHPRRRRRGHRRHLRRRRRIDRSVVVVGTALFVEAVCVAVGNVSSLTVRQKVIPPEIFGRVMGTFRLLILGSIPIGSIFGGLLASGLRSRDAVADGRRTPAPRHLGARARGCRRVVSTDQRLVIADA